MKKILIIAVLALPLGGCFQQWGQIASYKGCTDRGAIIVANEPEKYTMQMVRSLCTNHALTEFPTTRYTYRSRYYPSAKRSVSYWGRR